MYLRVSNERVIDGKMRTPGEVIEVDETTGRQACRDGYAKKVDGRAKTHAPEQKSEPAKVPAALIQPDPVVANQPTKSLAKVDPQGGSVPDNVKE